MIDSKTNKDNKNKKIIFYINILGVLILGFCLGYLVSDYYASKNEYSYSPGLRKKDTSGLIAPLLTSGSKKLLKGSLFDKSVNDFIQTSIENGDATNISFYYVNFKNGEWTSYNENEKYSPASLLKVPIMIAVYKLGEKDNTFLDKTIYFDGKLDLNKGEYYKPAKYITGGNSYTIDELVEYMIKYSDNNATALILSVIPPDVLNEIYSDLGLPTLSNNNDATVDYMSSKIYSTLFKVLYNCTYLNEEDSLKAMKLLTYADFPQGISAGVPTSTLVGNKFGERTILDKNGVKQYVELHDCGIVYAKSSPYILCIMTKGNNFDSLDKIIETISNKVYLNNF